MPRYAATDSGRRREPPPWRHAPVSDARVHRAPGAVPPRRPPPLATEAWSRKSLTRTNIPAS